MLCAYRPLNATPAVFVVIFTVDTVNTTLAIPVHSHRFNVITRQTIANSMGQIIRLTIPCAKF